MSKAKQQQLCAREVFVPAKTKFKIERIIPLFEDKTWSRDLIDKSFLKMLIRILKTC